MPSSWLFAPEKFKKNTNASKLEKNFGKKKTGSTKILEASDLTINLRLVYIKTSKDTGFFKKGNTNDLFISTSHQTGSTPIVQRVHEFIPCKELGRVGPFFKSIVCSFSDFKSKHLTLRLQIYDVDDYSDVIELAGDVSKFLAAASGIFPVAAPYLSIGSTAAKSIVELVNKVDKHDRIIDGMIKLKMSDPDIGVNILQTGHLVCFSEEPPKNLKITKNMRVIINSRKDFVGCNYAVFSIRKEAAEEPEWEVNQKVATLLTELESKGRVGKPAMGFLTDTLKGYSNFKKLNRVSELEERKKHASKLTEKIKKLKAKPKGKKNEIKKLGEKLKKIKLSSDEEDRLKKLKADEEISQFISTK